MLHTSHAVKSWLDENQVKVMAWPAQSSDLNPIKNFWMMVKHQFGNNIFFLMIQMEKEWNAIPIEHIHKLIASMPNICREVIKNK